MDLGLTGKLSEYYLGSVYQQSKAAEKSEGVSFRDAISAKAAEKVSGQINVTGMSFKDMWQARFPGGVLSYDGCIKYSARCMGKK